MCAIWIREFFYLCKGIKAFLLLTVFAGITYSIASLDEYFPFLVRDAQVTSQFSGGLRLLVMFFGLIFVTMVSHDVISKEVETQTIRFLVTKRSRTAIVVGKFLGVSSFWFLIATLSYVPVLYKIKRWDPLDYLQILAMLWAMASVTLLFSTLVRKSSYSLLSGLCFGMIYPMISILSLIKDGFPWSLMKSGSLVTLMQLKIQGVLILMVASAVFILASIYAFHRRDL